MFWYRIIEKLQWKRVRWGDSYVYVARYSIIDSIRTKVDNLYVAWVKRKG